METLTAILSGLVLASLSGITALAFKHPNAFAKLYPFLNLSVSIAFLGSSIWQVAVQITWTGILPFVQAEQHQAAYFVKAGLSLPYVWICVVYTALLVLFWINLKLPRFISNASVNHNRDEARNAR